MTSGYATLGKNLGALRTRRSLSQPSEMLLFVTRQSIHNRLTDVPAGYTYGSSRPLSFQRLCLEHGYG